MERMRANAIEAAEQCGILRIPELHAPEKLEHVVAGWDATRRARFSATRAASEAMPVHGARHAWRRARSPC